MFTKGSKIALTLLGVGIIPACIVMRAKGSDHADTPAIAAAPRTDITDVYVFPSPTNPDNVVLSMSVNPLIGAGQGPSKDFDPNALYEFKIDTNGDAIEDKVIQVRFTGTGAAQVASVTLPTTPSITGNTSIPLTPLATTGTINTVFSPTSGMQVFCGAREDSFFFDLERFFAILPDRATPINGISVPDPNVPKFTSWNPVGTAHDFLSVNSFNVLSIVIELPKSMLAK